MNHAYATYVGGQAFSKAFKEPSLDEILVWAVEGAKFHLENSGKKKVHKELCSRFQKRMNKKIKKLEEVYIYIYIYNSICIHAHVTYTHMYIFMLITDT